MGKMNSFQIFINAYSAGRTVQIFFHFIKQTAKFAVRTTNSQFAENARKTVHRTPWRWRGSTAAAWAADTGEPERIGEPEYEYPRG